VRALEAFLAVARRPAAAGRRVVALRPFLTVRLRAVVVRAVPRLAAVLLRVPRVVVLRVVFATVFLLVRATIESPPWDV
jgi:hypothetical protein